MFLKTLVTAGFLLKGMFQLVVLMMYYIYFYFVGYYEILQLRLFYCV